MVRVPGSGLIENWCAEPGELVEKVGGGAIRGALPAPRSAEDPGRDACALKPWCTSSKEGRHIHRSIDEDYLDRVRSHHQTEAYDKAMRKRKLWTEPLFAEAKLWHGMRRFRLRRLWRVNIEALMVAAAQNLKRLLRWRGRRCRPASVMAAPLPLSRGHPPLSGRIVARTRVVRRLDCLRRLALALVPAL